MQIEDLKKSVYDANMALVEHGLVIFTFGNVSGIDRERGLFAIKPSGVDYEKLEPEQMVLCDLDGNVAEAGLNPSSDTNTHAALYRAFPEIGGVAHTHSRAATAWAQACREIPCFGTTHADYLPGSVPCTRALTDNEINGDYETETARVIIERMKKMSPSEVGMMLVASHGPFTWGVSPEKAVMNSALLEEIAQMALSTISINPDCHQINPTLLSKHFQRKHGKNSYYGQKSS